MIDLISILEDTYKLPTYYNISSIVLIDATKNIYELFSQDCNTFWFSVCDKVRVEVENFPDINGEITYVNHNESILVQFESPIFGTEKRVQLPFASFTEGSVPMANIQISKDCFSSPIIYFYKSYRIEEQENTSPLEYVAKNVKIYFMSDFPRNDEWLGKDYRTNVERQMLNLAKDFVDKLKNNKLIDKEYMNNEKREYNVIPKISTNSDKSLFSRNLSGVELILSIPIKKCCNCKC